MRGLPRAWTGRDAALAAWLCGWLAFGAYAAAASLRGALARAEPAALARGLATPLGERERVALNPFGHRLLVLLRERTAPDATVYLVTDASPAMHRLWLGLSTWLFPRVIVPLPSGTPLPEGAPSLVIGRAGDGPPASGAERVDAGAGAAVWLVEPRTR